MSESPRNVYRLYHVPSGLYYINSKRAISWAPHTTNFGSKGKAYWSFPNISILNTQLNTNLSKKEMGVEVYCRPRGFRYTENPKDFQKYIRVNYSDWAVDVFADSKAEKPFARYYIHKVPISRH